jgi:hypothetical protein
MKSSLLTKSNWNMASTAASMATALLTKKLLDAVWQKSTGNKPPKNHGLHGVSLSQAMVYTVAAGVIAAVTKVGSRYALAHYWRKQGGRLPTAPQS